MWDRLLAHTNIFAWKRREKLLGKRFTVLCVCSEEDRRYLTRIGVRSPFTLSRMHSRDRPPSRFGILQRLPGLGLLASSITSRIVTEFSGLWISAGPELNLPCRMLDCGSLEKAATGCLHLAGPDVDALGWLTDPSDEIRTWSAMAVPIRIGAGTRVKIAQAFSLKCPVVSTTLGAHGYAAVNECDMFLADTAASFSDACVRAMREPALAAEIAERAWRRYLDHWTWEAVRPRVWAAAEDCLRLRATAYDQSKEVRHKGKKIASV